MQIRFENHSESGIFRQYAGFTLSLPGHAMGSKAVAANVPEPLVKDVEAYLTRHHPAVKMTRIAATTEQASVDTEEEAQGEISPADTGTPRDPAPSFPSQRGRSKRRR